MNKLVCILIQLLFVIASHGSLPPASSFAISPAASHLPSMARHTRTQLLHSTPAFFPICIHIYTYILKSLKLLLQPFQALETGGPVWHLATQIPHLHLSRHGQHFSILSSHRFPCYYPHIPTSSTRTIVMIPVFFDIGEMEVRGNSGATSPGAFLRLGLTPWWLLLAVRSVE